MCVLLKVPSTLPLRGSHPLQGLQEIAMPSAFEEERAERKKDGEICSGEFVAPRAQGCLVEERVKCCRSGDESRYLHDW